MTPRLVPYNWLRHLISPLVGAMAGLVAWWGAMVFLSGWRMSGYHAVDGALPLSAQTEGVVMLVVVAGTLAATQVLLEGRYERTPLRSRWASAGVATVLTLLFASVGLSLHELISERLLARPVHTLHLRWHLMPWAIAGGSVGLALAFVRWTPFAVEWIQKRWDFRYFDPPRAPDVPHRANLAFHLAGGPMAGVFAAWSWYLVGISLGDRFVASAAACWVLGAAAGGFMWAVPDRAYRGWLRVLVGSRPGWRIPLDVKERLRTERFVGHFPVGMDLHLPDTDGVAELHVSVLAKGHGDWAVRGLTRRTVRVERMLERLMLAYDRREPAPYEAPLHDGDRVVVADVTELEFVVLPAEGGP